MTQYEQHSTGWQARPAGHEPNPNFSLEAIMRKQLEERVHEDPRVTAVRTLVNENERLHKLAYTDELTGLPNRRSVMNTIDSLVQKEAGTFALMYVDLDDLKKYNTGGGHDAGDQLIISAATAIIGHNLRRRDEGGHTPRPHDIEGGDAARVGGDEFIVVLRGIENQEQLTVVNHRIITNLEDEGISASTGAALHERGQSREELVHLADRAMDLNKLERRAERQETEWEAVPEEERTDYEAVFAVMEERGVALESLWQLRGQTSR